MKDRKTPFLQQIFKITLLLILLVILAFGVYAFWPKQEASNPVSTQDVMGDEPADLWTERYEGGISFQYPERLTAKYIFIQEWPPVIEIGEGAYYCETTPLETSSLSEMTLQRSVDDRTYCVNIENEGAAGSVYSSYTYTTAKDGGLVSIRFSLRYPDCNDYGLGQAEVCANEREAFDIDATVDRIIQTVNWVTNFDECISAGFPMAKSNPPQCVTPDGRTFVQGMNSTWEQVQSAIGNCEVEKAFQAHSKIVTITLKNGNQLIAVEPELDDIMIMVGASGSKCGKIPLATE